MDTDAKGQLGGMDASEEVRKRFAGQSTGWRCSACGKANVEVMEEQDRAVEEAGGEGKKEEVPEELRLAYREDLAGKSGEKVPEAAPAAGSTNTITAPAPPAAPVVAPATPVTVRTVDAPAPQAQIRRPAPIQDDGIPAWIDKAIFGVAAALVVLVISRYVA